MLRRQECEPRALRLDCPGQRCIRSINSLEQAEDGALRIGVNRKLSNAGKVCGRLHHLATIRVQRLERIRCGVDIGNGDLAEPYRRHRLRRPVHDHSRARQSSPISEAQTPASFSVKAELAVMLRRLGHTDLVERQPSLPAHLARCEGRPAVNRAMVDHLVDVTKSVEA